MTPNILIIDDEQSLREYICRVLKSENFNVRSAANSSDAKELVNLNNFSVIVVDILLPDQSGLEFVKEIQEKGSTAQIIIVTGSRELEYAQEAVRLDVYDYILKPFNTIHFLQAIKNAHAKFEIKLEKKELKKQKKEYLDLTEQQKVLQMEKKYELQLIKEHRMAAIGQLASGVAHNLNTPISIIQGNAELLNLKYPNVDEIEKILRQTQRMNELIHTIISKGRYVLSNDEGDIDLNSLLKVEIEFFKSNLYFKHYIKCEQNLDPYIPLLYGRYSDYSQSISVIIQNAIDSMYKMEKRELFIQTKNFKDYAELTIRDTGCGIEEDNLARIWDSFFTTKPSLDDKLEDGKIPRGTGLGLSMAHTIFERCGVDVSLTSDVGKGTEFILKFPHKANRKNVIKN
jgi:signal transduction histidine kinase